MATTAMAMAQRASTPTLKRAGGTGQASGIKVGSSRADDVAIGRLSGAIFDDFLISVPFHDAPHGWHRAPISEQENPRSGRTRFPE
jgi:hypothetical protein